MVIGLPILKDHEMAGVTFAMKNMYGVVERPQDLHGNSCNPGVADLNCIPVIRDKVRFTIGDAMSSVYNGGPGLPPRAPVAAQRADRGRGSRGRGSHRMADDRAQARRGGRADAGGRGPPAAYIATAADATHQLGVNDPARITDGIAANLYRTDV